MNRTRQFLCKLPTLRMITLGLFLFLLLMVFVGVVLGLYQPFAILRIVQKAIPDVLFYVDTNRPHVALTLDDGPDGDVTPRVLQILKKYRVPATWFLIGSRVQEFEETFREIVSDGHEVANHFWAERPTTWHMDRERFISDLARTEALIGQKTQPKFLRPASGWFRPWALEETKRLGYKLVLGSAYTSDSVGPPSFYIVWALSRLARPGSVIVLHVGPGRTYTAELLPQLIENVRAKGLDFVTLEKLWAERER